ncbi:MAG: response regulator [Magnetococcales bacterium]|nr:response regulator [Magnetococcales bacterium]
MQNSVLIIEDEEDLITTLEYNLQQEGYRVLTALSGEEGLKLADDKNPPDLILLDIMLPGMSGIEVCRCLKENPDTKRIPILFLSAKGEDIDRVVGFEMGADDYVVKPYNVRELLLRVRAIIRRSQENPTQKNTNTASDKQLGIIIMDREKHRVWVSDNEINLTAIEFKLLTTFMENRGRVQTRELLLDRVWGANVYVLPRTVDAHVKRLRVKLGVAGKYVETIRGVGYRFNEINPGNAT